MGYYTRVTGEIHIEPPLTWQEFKNSCFLPGSPNDNGNYDILLHADEETIDTDEGQLVRKTASAVLPRWDDSFKAYNLIEHVQAVIDAFPDHTFTGRLECEGEDSTDMWRVVVRDGRAVKVEPRIVWPDEDSSPTAEQLEQARRIAVALEQENAQLADENAELKAANNPRLPRLLVKAAPDKDLYVGWSMVADGPTGVWSRETAIAYGFPPSWLNRADDTGTSRDDAPGSWASGGFVADQRGWLKRERLGDYAVEYLNGDRQAAYRLLEPFEGETEVRS